MTHLSVMHQPLVVFMILATLLVATFPSAQAEDVDGIKRCHVYTIGSNSTSNQTPTVPFQKEVSISFFDTGDKHGRLQTMVTLSQNNISYVIYINSDADMVLRSHEKVLGNMTLPSLRDSRGLEGHGGTWWTMVMRLHDRVLVVYSLDDPLGVVLSAEVELEDSVAFFVASSTTTHLVFDCPTGCHTHNGNSPLVDRWLDVPTYLNLYISPLKVEGSSSNFSLSFAHHKSRRRKREDEDVFYISKALPAGLWYRVQMVREGERLVKLQWEGEEKIIEEKMQFKVSQANDYLWSLFCYPDDAGDKESWITKRLPTPAPTPKVPSASNAPKPDEGGVGEGVVWAWVLAGLAFFLVMVLALALCTRMKPSHEMTSHGDYLPSIGVLSRDGREGGGREAEEMSEPGSPTIPLPVINHKVPEENDHSTKQL